MTLRTSRNSVTLFIDVYFAAVSGAHTFITPSTLEYCSINLANIHNIPILLWKHSCYEVIWTL